MTPKYPPRATEPACIHYLPGVPDAVKQPASVCRLCWDGAALREWRDGWAAWFAAHPDDPRNPAREVAR
jgi:hypothetical protein